MEDNIEINIKSIEQRIISACINSGRSPEEVRLLMATKTVAAEDIKRAMVLGKTLIGENKVQELKEKFAALGDVPHTNHFIGHLQSNKIKDILKYGVSCVQSIDKIELAEKLNERLAIAKKKMDILIQVNTSNEDSKFGVHPDNVVKVVKHIAKLENVKIQGLMTIGLLGADQEKVRGCFKMLKEIQQLVISEQIPSVNMSELSMGMSGDLEIAIEEGATIIRVGTAIFGVRVTPDSYYWNENTQ